MECSRRDILIALAGALLIRPLKAVAEKRSRSLTPPAAPLSEDERRCLAAAMDRLVPGSVEAGAVEYLSFWFLTEPFRAMRAYFAEGVNALHKEATDQFKKPFAALSGEEQDSILKQFSLGKVKTRRFSSAPFFQQLMEMTIEGYLSDPRYGGNRNRAGWRFIGIPDGLKSCWWNPDGVATVLGPKPKFSD